MRFLLALLTARGLVLELAEKAVKLFNVVRRKR